MKVSLSDMLLAALFGAMFAVIFFIGDRIEYAREMNNPGSSNIIGDDNSDGRIDKNESGWNCLTMGDLICDSTDK